MSFVAIFSFLGTGGDVLGFTPSHDMEKGRHDTNPLNLHRQSLFGLVVTSGSHKSFDFNAWLSSATFNSHFDLTAIVFGFTGRVEHGEFFPFRFAARILAICGLGGFLRLLVGKDGTQAAHGL